MAGLFLIISLSLIVIIPYILIKGLLSFIFKPVDNITTSKTPETPHEVIIKPNTINTDNIIEWEGDEYSNFSWSPQRFTQFIGQEDAKEQAKIIMKKMDKKIRCHVILSAIQGHGKSSFIRILANEMGAKLIERVGKEINEDTIVDIINEINICPEKKVIFFLDEIDTTDWKVLKLLNPILQDFKMSGKKVKPFCFCSATINKDILIKTVPDLIDRIPHNIQFTRYSNDELVTILKQYKKQLYPEEFIKEDIYKIISSNSKYNPRLAIGILEDYIVTKNINKTLKSRRIIKKGITEIDMKVLKVLSKSKKAIGANALSQRIGMTQNQYLREIEPYLVEFGYLARVPSRIITDKGKKILEEINEKTKC